MEGLRRQRASRMFQGAIRHRFLPGIGMVSDDTEHACLTALALGRCNRDEKRFARLVGRGLRAWLCTLPAGAGLATLKATLKLSVGVSPLRSGVPSAGNGAAMRAPIIGAYFAGNPGRIRKFAEVSSRVTHTDPRAVDGAFRVAMASAGISPLDEAASVESDCWHLASMKEHLDRGAHPSEFAESLGLENGVSGFVAHTVPMALYCALWADDDYPAAVTAAISLGGDTDTVGAITGGIVGARVGFDGLPAEWVDGILEWPRSVSWMRRLAAALAHEKPMPSTFWPGYLVRSPVFIGVVLAHGLRRILPPY